MRKRWMTEADLRATPTGRLALERDARARLPVLLKAQRPARKAAPSQIEESMAAQIYQAGIDVVRQYAPIPGRKFRMDFAWPELKVGLEVQGAVHRIKGRWKAESERRALLVLAGWRVLEVNGDDVRAGRALEWLKCLLRDEVLAR